jgi:glutamate/tyrosine decarboxylase-like PLP-dependent enzyme
MINKRELDLLGHALEVLEAGTSDLPAFTPAFDADRAASILGEVAERMQDNYPYHHPQYAGQMLKPPHPVARMAYALSLWVNPNNHALDGGRASSAMEKECIGDLGRLFGWEAPLGHLTNGGTMANLEALWVAGRLHAGKRVVASEQAHYTHGRITDVLGLPYEPLPVDAEGRIDIVGLETMLKKGDIGTVVVTIGTTGLGVVDPLPGILALRDRYEFRIHADAAYGGYFGLSSLLHPSTRKTYEMLHLVDSIVIDPHKHGLQPYGCGCILFKDPSVGKLYKHGSPYTYFSSAELHLGEISLECSRAGASAVALWATMQLLPLQSDGEFAAGLDASLRAARALWQWLEQSEVFVPLMQPELDIVVYLPRAADTRQASARAREVFEQAARHDLHLALADFPVALVAANATGMTVNTDSVTCLRSVLMKPEHEDWLERITALLEASAR